MKKKNSVRGIDELNSFFFVNNEQGIQQRMLILRKGTQYKDTLHQGTPNKGMLHNSMPNLLLKGKRPVFLKDGMPSFSFFLINSCFLCWILMGDFGPTLEVFVTRLHWII